MHLTQWQPIHAKIGISSTGGMAGVVTYNHIYVHFNSTTGQKCGDSAVSAVHPSSPTLPFWGLRGPAHRRAA